MVSIRSYQSTETTKMLFIGESGSGKTGALASLAAAGYNLRILDLDNGCDVLVDLLTSKSSPYPPDAADRVEVQTIMDSMKKLPTGKLVPGKAEAWNKAMSMLTHWKGDGVDLGPVSSWGPKDILVIDSLSLLCTAALNFILAMNGRLGLRTEQSDWYGAQQLIETLMQMLYDKEIRCNVIVITHVTFIGDDNSILRGMPASLGKALSPKLGRYFNNTVMIRSSGAGAAVKRQIITQPTGQIELKTSAPTRVAPSYEIKDGLAKLFEALRAAPEASPAVSSPMPKAAG